MRRPRQNRLPFELEQVSAIYDEVLQRLKLLQTAFYSALAVIGVFVTFLGITATINADDLKNIPIDALVEAPLDFILTLKVWQIFGLIAFPWLFLILMARYLAEALLLDVAMSTLKELVGRYEKWWVFYYHIANIDAMRRNKYFHLMIGTSYFVFVAPIFLSLAIVGYYLNEIGMLFQAFWITSFFWVDVFITLLMLGIAVYARKGKMNPNKPQLQDREGA